MRSPLDDDQAIIVENIVFVASDVFARRLHDRVANLAGLLAA